MKIRLLDYLRCPECRATFALRDATTEAVERVGGPARTRCAGACGAPRLKAPNDDCEDCARLEVIEGSLACTGCGATSAILEGVPRLGPAKSPDPTRPRTAASFGYLWAKSIPGAEVYDVTSYHFAKMERSLTLAAPHGLVLDAGCGDGIDLANQAQREGVEVIGVELSDGGCLASYERTRRLARAHVVQADLCRLPFADGTFDFAYSYGVLHHLGVPERGLRSVVRVLRSGARVVAYLYEDFSERSVWLRWSLAAVNATRALTTRLPHRVLYALCQVGSPVVFTMFTLPASLARHFKALAPVGASLPFRHGTGPFSLVGDLYDRFSAPVEWRYSRAGSAAFFAEAGLDHVFVAFERGWMVSGVKPVSTQALPPTPSC
jgi:SAM-dependent methyltransferase